MSDTNEWLRTDAADFRQAVDALRPSDPLPAGATFTPAVNLPVDNGLREPALMQVTGVRLAFADYARCLWKAQWLDAHARPTIREQTPRRRSLPSYWRGRSTSATVPEFGYFSGKLPLTPRTATPR